VIDSRSPIERSNAAASEIPTSTQEESITCATTPKEEKDDDTDEE
jgi:hypothetical protein